MMKKIRISTAFIVMIYAVCVFVCVWLAWYFNFYHALMWYEGYSYFSTLPDFTALSAVFPNDILKYIGAFLLQFFYYPALGAAVEACFAVLVFLCAAIVFIRLFDKASGLLWVALIPVAVYVGRQFWDFDLTKSLQWCIWALLAVASVWCLTSLRRWRMHVPRLVSHPVVGGVSSVVLLCLVYYNIVFRDNSCRMYQQVWKMEYLADTRQWDALLEIATPEAAQTNDIIRRYAVLALLEKGLLADRMFLYGVTGPNDFWFANREEPLCRSYNALLLRSLGMPNEVIHQTFQQQVQSNFGTCFTVLRRLVEINLETKNYVLAKKYMDILSHSTMMKGWVEKRKPQLEAIRNVKPVFEAKGEQFHVGDLLVMMAAMVDRYPNNRKYADILLCGLLAQKNGDSFYPAFKIVAQSQYAHGERIPHYYEEALMLIAPKEPEVLQNYVIGRDVQEAFQNVMLLMNNGDIARMKYLYPNSFWAYCF